MKKGNRKIKNAGTCALTVVVVDNTVYVANSGDSEAILIYEKEENQNCYTLNHRFNASDELEQTRLRAEFP
jgi:serine/threonine protein phosphatase PrpC